MSCPLSASSRAVDYLHLEQTSRLDAFPFPWGKLVELGYRKVFDKHNKHREVVERSLAVVVDFRPESRARKT